MASVAMNASPSRPTSSTQQCSSAQSTPRAIMRSSLMQSTRPLVGESRAPLQRQSSSASNAALESDPVYANLFALQSLYANVNVNVNMNVSCSWTQSLARQQSAIVSSANSSSQPASPLTPASKSLNLYALPMPAECSPSPPPAAVGASALCSSSSPLSVAVPLSNAQYSPTSSAGGSYGWNAGGEADTSGHSSLSPSCRGSVQSSCAGEPVAGSSPAVSEPTSPIALSYDEANNTGTVIRRAISKDSANVTGAAAVSGAATSASRASSSALKRRDSFTAATSDSALDICSGQTSEEKALDNFNSPYKPSSSLHSDLLTSERGTPPDKDTDRTLVQEQRPSTQQLQPLSMTPGCYQAMSQAMSKSAVHKLQTSHSNSSTLTRSHASPNPPLAVTWASPIGSDLTSLPSPLPAASRRRSVRSGGEEQLESDGEATLFANGSVDGASCSLARTPQECPSSVDPNSSSSQPSHLSLLLHESSQSLAANPVTQYSPSSQLGPSPPDSYYNSWPRKVALLRPSFIAATTVCSAAEPAQFGVSSPSALTPQHEAQATRSSNPREILLPSFPAVVRNSTQQMAAPGFVVYSTLGPRESILPPGAEQVAAACSGQSPSASNACTSWPLTPDAFPTPPLDMCLRDAFGPDGAGSDSSSNEPTPPPALLPRSTSDSPDSDADPLVLREPDSNLSATKHTTRSVQRPSVADQLYGGKHSSITCVLTRPEAHKQPPLERIEFIDSKLERDGSRQPVVAPLAGAPPPPGFADSPSMHSLAETYATGTVIRRPKGSSHKPHTSCAVVAPPTRAEYVNICVSPPGRRGAHQLQYDPITAPAPFPSRVGDEKRIDQQSRPEIPQASSNNKNCYTRDTIQHQYGPSLIAQRH